MPERNRRAEQGKIAVIFGGTGFVGTQIVQSLAQAGLRIKIATRYPAKAYGLRPCGDPGQIAPVFCDGSEDSIRNVLSGADYAVNCTGILFERRKGDFARVHTDIPQRIARACNCGHVSRFVHISALGADKAASRYARTKREGERAVRAEFPDATILRPSLIFGPDDSFFNRFAELARYLPALPLIGGGHTKFQPVYVGDVAAAVTSALTVAGTYDDSDPRGRTFELGGPEICTFRDLFERMALYTQRPRPLLPIPWALAAIQARFLSLLPEPLLTRDQVETLKTDNIVGRNALTLRSLGIDPTAMNVILSGYLDRFHPPEMRAADFQAGNVVPKNAMTSSAGTL